MSGVFTFLNETIKVNAQLENDVKGEDHLRDDLGLDSLGILALADAVEEKFDIALEAEDLAETPATVNAFVELVEKKIGK